MAQAFGEELVHSKQLEEAWSMEVFSTAAKLSLSKMLKVSFIAFIVLCCCVVVVSVCTSFQPVG